MSPDLENLQTLDGNALVGILIALVGAVFLSVGAQLQHRGVVKVEASHGSGAKAGLNLQQLLRLLVRPSWLFGSIMLGLAIVFQLTSLGFAPLIVVQPLGVVGLIITSMLNARVSKVRLDKQAIRAISLCVAGVGVFVVTAAIFAVDTHIGETQLLTVVIILAVVVAVLATGFALFRQKLPALFYIIAAGVLYGFVATLAKVVITRIRTGNFEWLSILAIVALIGAAALGAYFVQTAYSVGSPDLVIAGLTVVDPMVAVAIAVVVLGEASKVPLPAIIAWIVAGAVAVFGVFQLARHHPQTHQRDTGEVTPIAATPAVEAAERRVLEGRADAPPEPLPTTPPSGTDAERTLPDDDPEPVPVEPRDEDAASPRAHPGRDLP
ncbi:DMT family transporter [Schumannella sp. 10F1B-5-1]|uniref:DMT family transporter n=1 Tax=Schumannella sp. 10F1B-5-1 TaxID=2590780 RepID=UPI0015E82DC9|nr:DMT family transporter [Schumannella sp. 10F1B-5-1]